MGVFLSLTRARNEKSRPSRAIAKIMRGSGNMEPRRLSQRWRKKEEEEEAEICNCTEMFLVSHTASTAAQHPDEQLRMLCQDVAVSALYTAVTEEETLHLQDNLYALLVLVLVLRPCVPRVSWVTG